MSDQSKEKDILGEKALELVMRDVLYGMEDLAAMLGYRSNPGGVEILSIEPVTPAQNELPTGHLTPTSQAVVLPFPAANDPRLRQRRYRAN